MGRYDVINAVLTAVHDAGLIGTTAVDISDKHGLAQNRVTAALYGLWKGDSVRRAADEATGNFRYWYVRERGERKPPEVRYIASAPEVEAPSVPHETAFLIPLGKNEEIRLTMSAAKELYGKLADIFKGA